MTRFSHEKHLVLEVTRAEPDRVKILDPGTKLLAAVGPLWELSIEREGAAKTTV